MLVMLKYRYHTRYVTCVSRSLASAGSRMGKLERVRLMRGCDCQKCKIIAKQQLYISECWTSDNWSMRETFYIFAAARPCFGVMTGKLFRSSGPCIGHTQTMGLCAEHETRTSVQSSHKHRGTQSRIFNRINSFVKKIFGKYYSPLTNNYLQHYN